MREQTEHLFLTSGVAFLEPFGGAAVQARPIGGEHAAVRALLDQRVFESVLGLRPATLLAHEIETLELVERLSRGAISAGDSLQQRNPEVPPEHGRGDENVARGVRKPVDARDDHLLNGRRQIDLGVVVETPLLAGADECARVDERADELFEEERVALGAREYAGTQFVRQRVSSDQCVEQISARIPRERVEYHLRHAVRKVARGEIPDSPGRMVPLDAHHEDEQHAGVLRHRQQALDELQRRRIGPVEILEDEQHGSVFGQPSDERRDDFERPVLQRLRRKFGEL